MNNTPLFFSLQSVGGDRCDVKGAADGVRRSDFGVPLDVLDRHSLIYERIRRWLDIIAVVNYNI